MNGKDDSQGISTFEYTGKIHFSKPNGFRIEIEDLVNAMEKILGYQIREPKGDFLNPLRDEIRSLQDDIGELYIRIGELEDR